METNIYQARAVLASVTLLTEHLIEVGEAGIYRLVTLEADRAVFRTVLQHVRGNRSHASELMGISRTTLRAKLRDVRKEMTPASNPQNGGEP